MILRSIGAVETFQCLCVGIGRGILFAVVVRPAVGLVVVAIWGIVHWNHLNIIFPIIRIET